MSIPYMPLYVTDYDADTSHLTLEEDGVYNRLLRLCWRTPGCSVPDDDAWIMRMLRTDAETMARVVRPIIAEFFCVEKGRVFSRRLLKEFEKVSATREKRVDAGKKGGRPKGGVENIEKTVKAGFVSEKAGPKQPEPEPEPDKKIKSSPRGFDEFWKAFPQKGRVAKKAAATSFERAVKAGTHPEQILAGAQRYSRSQPVAQGFVMHAARWLDKGRWADEDTSSAPVDFLAIAGRRRDGP